MRTFNLRKMLDASTMLKCQASQNDYDLLIDETAFVNLEGQSPVIYLDANEEAFRKVLPHLTKLRFPRSKRTSGVDSRSIRFGATPRNAQKNDFCSNGALLNHDEFFHDLLMGPINELLTNYLSKVLPDAVAFNQKAVADQNIHPDYLNDKNVFTSGIINKNSNLSYHLDGNNLTDTYSMMVILSYNISGGYLCLPEYRAAIRMKNESILIFKGKNIIHGVTEILAAAPDAYRYSIVYFCSKELNKCLGNLGEVERFKNQNYDK